MEVWTEEKEHGTGQCHQTASAYLLAVLGMGYRWGEETWGLICFLSSFENICHQMCYGQWSHSFKLFKQRGGESTTSMT